YEWTDKNGNFWMYGGVINLSSEDANLWKYDPINNLWTWMNGPGPGSFNSVYGIKGVPSATNQPGSRGWGGLSWTDTAGNLYLMGGHAGGYSRNDLWKYDVGSNLWTWVSGSNSPFAMGNYGIKGIPSPS